MEESNIWMIGIVALLIGALIGYLLGRAGGNSGEKEQLDEAKQELEDYKTKVASHFEETADLVNKMTESYRGVYKHLATSAQTLCDADTARSIESSMTPQLTVQKEVIVEEPENSTTADKPKANTDAEKITNAEPPRDYAPKKPDQKGTLSESYGLDKEAIKQSEAKSEKTSDKQETAKKPETKPEKQETAKKSDKDDVAKKA
ncbi:YhcB family protein [Neptunomonas sp.]|uniref:YhcB family protein n=1 Tax=Neptunomonas sp. TaxID=1971898 RepID=UPI00356A2992